MNVKRIVAELRERGYRVSSRWEKDLGPMVFIRKDGMFAEGLTAYGLVPIRNAEDDGFIEGLCHELESRIEVNRNAKIEIPKAESSDWAYWPERPDDYGPCRSRLLGSDRRVDDDAPPVQFPGN